MFRRLALPLLAALILGGCESGIDAWEGVLNADIDQDDDIAGDETDGNNDTDADGLAYPEGMDKIYDLAVVGSDLWLWAEDFDDDIAGPVLVRLSLISEAGEETIIIDGRPGLLNAGSELTWDGEAFWFTSDERDPVNAQLYRVDRNGNFLDTDTVACPFAGTAGCQGLAWDGAFLWTAEDGGTQVAQVSPDPDAAVPNPFEPWSDTTTAIDFLFAERADDGRRALAVRNGRLYWILSSTESASEEQAADFNRGGADDATIWHPSDTERRIFSTSVPTPP